MGSCDGLVLAIKLIGAGRHQAITWPNVELIIISEALWLSFEINFTRDTSATNP